MGGTSPCASCKLLRRRCAKDCIFAPYFPPDDPQKFAMVHKVFGASNVSKMLQELAIEERGDAVNSLVYEANARLRDPVYGCVGAISYLQNQVSQLQMQLAVAQAQLLCIQMQQQEEEEITITTGGGGGGLLPYNNYTFMPNNNNINNINIMNLHDHHDEMDVPDHEKSILLSPTNYLTNLQQYLTFASPSTNTTHVIHDPLKRESLWT